MFLWPSWNGSYWRGAAYLSEVVKIFNIYIIILVANFTIILVICFLFVFFLQSFLPFADCLQHVLCLNVYIPYKKKNMWAQN